MIKNWKTATTTIGLLSVAMAAPNYAVADGSWAERIKFKGDFRYRYEFINEEKKEERRRNRLRLRLGLTGQVNDTVEIGAMFASGGTDPVSTNQTLGDEASTKDIRLDQGYFAWKPMKGLTIKGGKFQNPFYKPVKSELLWDADIRPEGLILQYDNGLFVNAGILVVEERKTKPDPFITALQAGYKAKFGETKLNMGAGYFDYTEIKGYDDLTVEGNTADANGNFVTDYNQLELFGDLTLKVGVPLSFFVDYVLNTAADNVAKDEDTGYVVGFKVGKAKEPSSWDFRYNYREVKADAVFGAFSDSDFVGGGTNGKGHELNFGYMIAKNWKFAVSYFNNTKNIRDGETEKDYERVQVDLKFNF